MTAGNTRAPGAAHGVTRRAFLGGTLRAGGTLLAAGLAVGCEANSMANSTRSGGSRIDHRPNDGSGLWADFSNTGYKHDPGYTGTGGNCTHGYPGLNDYTSNMSASSLLYVDESAGKVFNQVHFLGLTMMLGHGRGDDWTFNGCVFDAGNGSDMVTQTYLPTSYTQNYCTFKPSAYSTPPGNDGIVSTSHTPPGTICAKQYQSFDTNSNGSQTGGAVVHRYHCDVWGNAGMQDVFNGSAGHHVTLDWCYIHDQADTNNSGGCNNHNDGIGPTAVGRQGYLDITNCTIASLGNTNGIAFQNSGIHDMVISGNYLAGWGYTVHLGAAGTAGLNYNIAFTGNVFSAEVAAIYGPLYGGSSAWPSGNRGMLWHGNMYQFFPGDPSLNRTYQAHHWWPSDGNPHASDYTG